MKKFLLVTLIGMVLAINLYGLIDNIMDYYESKNVEEPYKGYVTVQVE